MQAKKFYGVIKLNLLNQIIDTIRANDGNGLIAYFDGVAYSRCRHCGDFLNVGKGNTCDECSKK